MLPPEVGDQRVFEQPKGQLRSAKFSNRLDLGRGVLAQAQGAKTKSLKEESNLDKKSAAKQSWLNHPDREPLRRESITTPTSKRCESSLPPRRCCDEGPSTGPCCNLEDISWFLRWVSDLAVCLGPKSCCSFHLRVRIQGFEAAGEPFFFRSSHAVVIDMALPLS